MSEIKLVFRLLWVVSFTIRRLLPTQVRELTSVQFLAIVAYINGKIRERVLLSRVFSLPQVLFFFCMKGYQQFRMIELLEPLCDFRQPCNRFLIEQLPGTELICPGEKLKGVTFMQFMYIDTMYTQYLQSENNHCLNHLIASLYLQKEIKFQDVDINEQGVYVSKSVDSVTREAILLNYMMVKIWLSDAYPFMFPSGDENGASSTGSQSRWLDIFDSFVGENIHNTPYYKTMPCMDAFRIIDKRIKEYYHAKK